MGGMVLLHFLFVSVSYDPNIGLSFFGNNAIIIERTLMLTQFLPLILILANRELSRNRFLLFLAFALCVSTIYAVDDFDMGFFGALLDNGSGIVPRMRASAHLMAFEDTGRITILNYHAEYFQEFLVVNTLSEFTGLNYIIVYASFIRITSIILWSLLFVWASSRIIGSFNNVFSYLLAFSMLIANPGYNYEFSFASLLLIMLFLVIIEHKFSLRYIACTLLLTLGILVASFRETSLLLLIFALELFIFPLVKMIRPSLISSRIPKVLSLALFLLPLSRVFVFSSRYYYYRYSSWLTALVDQIWLMLRGEWMPKGAPLATLSTIQNPVDRLIGYVSVISFITMLIVLGVLSLDLLLRRRIESLPFSVTVVYLAALALPVAAYAGLRLTGFGVLTDFSTATILARSMAPLVVLVTVPFLAVINNAEMRGKQVLRLLAILGISVGMIFGPLTFLRGDVKSSYDMQIYPADANDRTILGNHLYEFILFHTAGDAEFLIRSSPAEWLQHYYLLPLEYRTGKYFGTGPANLNPFSRAFDDGLYAIYVCNETIVLDELVPAS